MIALASFLLVFNHVYKNTDYFKNIKYYTSSNTPEDVVAVLVNDLKVEEFEQYGIQN